MEATGAKSNGPTAVPFPALILGCDAAASQVVLQLGLLDASRFGLTAAHLRLRQWLEWHYPYTLCLVGGELLDDAGSERAGTCRPPNSHSAERRALRSMHSLEVSSGGSPVRHAIWQLEKPMQIGRSLAAAATLGTNLYILGGQRLKHRLGACHSRWCPLSAVERYDAEHEVWEMLPPMPTARKSLAAVVLGGFLYAVGGSNGRERLKTAERLHLEKRRWEVLPSLPRLRENLQMASSEGKILATGDGKIDIFDPALQCWLELEHSLPVAVDQSTELRPRRHSARATLQSHIYVCGGYQDFKPCRRVDVLDLHEKNPARTHGPNLPMPCAGAAVALLRRRR